MLWNLVRNLVIVLKLKESNLFKTRVKHHIIFIVFHINIVKTTHKLSNDKTPGGNRIRNIDFESVFICYNSLMYEKE